VHRGVQRAARGVGLDALEDHRGLAHRRADEAALTGERRRGPLPHHPRGSALVLLEPREVVVVVHVFERGRAEDATHLLAHHVAARVRVATRQAHRLDIARAELAVDLQQRRGRVHLTLRRTRVKRQTLREREEARCGLVAEAAAAEVHAHPHAVLLVGEQVDVVVAGSDGPELLGREVTQRPLRRKCRVADLVDHGMVARAPVVATDTEADALHDLIHQPRQLRLHLLEDQVRQHRLVATADVVTDSGGADVLRVGDHAPDRLAVTQVPVGTQHPDAALRSRDATLELRDRPLVVLAEDPDPVRPVHDPENAYYRDDARARGDQLGTAVEVGGRGSSDE
jgi:hypothetical protein